MDYRSSIGRTDETFPSVNECFIKACLAILTEAFRRMKEEKKFNLTDEEPRFSATLIGYMRKIKNEKPNCALRFDQEYTIYDDEMLDGIGDPKTAPRIDIKISGAWVEEDQYYGIEAKILVEKNWNTRRAKYLQKRYIDTGIDNFVNGNYSHKVNVGCIAGYVVQGSGKAIVKKINEMLCVENRDAEQLVDLHSINGCDLCHNSKHIRITDNQLFEIKHVFLICN